MADIASISSSYFNRPSPAERLIANNDKDGDGKLSLDEFKAIGQNSPSSSANSAGSSTVDRADLFKQIDTNGDGSVTKDELTAYQQQQVTDMKAAMLNLQELFGGSAQGARGGGHHHGHHHHAAQSSDTGQDGQTLSAVQSTGTTSTADGTSADPADALMKIMDANNDGSVSKDEISAFLQKLQKAA